jgi:hypothetical protein
MRQILTTLLLLVPLVAGAAECKYSAERKLDLDAGSLQQLTLNLGSSDARIDGVAGLKKIEVRGRVCASRQSYLADYQLTHRTEGTRAEVSAQSARGSHISLFGYRYMNVTVRVPASMAVSVDSGSGDMHARGLASLDVHSGSGDLQASDIAGALTLQTGSGDIMADHVGSVQVRNTGSGDIRIDSVRGDVSAGYSGSGDMHYGHVGGDVSIKGTGSGDITVRDVKGSVHVGSTGSGDVDADGVGGDLTVGSTGSGDVSYHGVRGKVDVPRDDD